MASIVLLRNNITSEICYPLKCVPLTYSNVVLILVAGNLECDSLEDLIAINVAKASGNSSCMIY